MLYSTEYSHPNGSLQILLGERKPAAFEKRERKDCIRKQETAAKVAKEMATMMMAEGNHSLTFSAVKSKKWLSEQGSHFYQGFQGKA